MKVSTTFLCFAIFIVVAWADPCVWTSHQPIQFSQALACFQSVEFSEEIRTKTIDSLKKTIPFYAFLDDVKAPPYEIDLAAALDALATQDFTSDMEFHSVLWSLFNGLDDAHTQYRVPACYSFPTIAYGIPFLGMYSAIVNDTQKIFLGKPIPSMVPFYQSNYGINLNEFSDQEILQINGEDALDYMMDYADNYVGISKDHSVRFNIALMPGFWGYPLRNLQTLSEPAQYLISGQTSPIDLPLFALPLATVSSSAEFASICNGPAPDPNQVGAAKAYLKTLVPPPNVPPVDNSTSIQLLLSGDQISFWTLNNSIAIVQIHSFEPNNSTVFEEQMKQGFRMCVSRFVQDYIIDLTGNGGGDIELGYAFIQYLFPLFNPLNMYDEKRNPLGDALAQAGAANMNVGSDWTPNGYLNAKHQVFSDASWYLQGRNFTRGGVNGEYTQQFSFNFGPLDSANSNQKRDRSVNNLLILSKGFCGSTCAVTARHLHQFDGVFAVSACGIEGESQGYTSFPGGQVYELDELVADLQQYNLMDHPLAPQNLPTSAVFRFAIKEIYGPDLTVPAEFVEDEADFRLACTPTSATNQHQLWIDTVPFFGQLNK